MHPSVEELESILKRAAAFADGPSTDVPALTEWLRERQMIFSRLESMVTELSSEDQRAMAQALKEMLAFDAVLLPVLEKQLSQIGQEITGARKIHQLLGKSAHSRPASVFQRSL